MAKATQPQPKRRVLIVDDHELMRHGLSQLINQEADLEVCGEAADIPGALHAIETLQPDIAVVDISLKGGSGIDLIETIMARWAKLPVLVLSMHDESFYAERVLRAGARGYVTKAEASAVVIDGIRDVLAGGVYVSSNIAAKMICKMVGTGSASTVFPIDRLTPREFEIFELIGKGLQGRDIAKRLHLSIKTVDAHREHIKKKLDLESATELLKYAVQWVQFEQGS